jgi:hypothetical protein
MKRMYTEVVINGVQVKLAVRASNEEEARIRLVDYQGIDKVISVTDKKPSHTEVAYRTNGRCYNGKQKFDNFEFDSLKLCVL